MTSSKVNLFFNFYIINEKKVSKYEYMIPYNIYAYKFIQKIEYTFLYQANYSYLNYRKCSKI